MASEFADKNMKDLQSSSQLPSTSPVNKLNTHGTQSLCYRCWDKHKVTYCHFKTVECHKCEKKGHIARVCIEVSHYRELSPTHNRRMEPHLKLPKEWIQLFFGCPHCTTVNTYPQHTQNVNYLPPQLDGEPSSRGQSWNCIYKIIPTAIELKFWIPF